MSAMQMETTDRDGVIVVAMSGDLEVQEIDGFKTAMDKVLNKGPQPKTVLDVSRVTRMTSYVIALIGFYNAQFKQAKGRFVVAGATSPAQRALELSGLTEVVTTARTLNEALEMFKA